jgi:3D (Asp-Asp-Asp) domain-containing protein
MLIASVTGLLAVGGVSWLVHPLGGLGGRAGLMVIEEASGPAPGSGTVGLTWKAPGNATVAINTTELDETVLRSAPRAAGKSALVMLPQPEVQVPAPSKAPTLPGPVPVPGAGVGAAMPRFDGRPVKPVRTMRMLVTAYSPDEKSCGKWAAYKKTASGYSVYTNGMRLVAADRRVLPFGSLVAVPGYSEGKPVPVLDVGGAIKGNRLDVLYPTDAQARKWGQRWVTVTIWDYADK